MTKRRILPYLLILPSLMVLTVLYLVPIAYFLVVSFWQVENYRIAHDFTLDNYRQVVGEYLPVALLTLRLAAITAVCTTLLGFVYAYIARFKAGRWGPLLLFAALV